MKKQVTFSIGKTKEKIDVFYKTKPIFEIQKIMRKLSKENPDDDIWAHWEVEEKNDLCDFDMIESYNYRQEWKKL